MVHLQLVPGLAAAAGSRRASSQLLQALADRLLDKHGLLVAVPRHSNLDRVSPPPSLKLYVNAGLQADKVAKVAGAVREAAKHVLNPLLSNTANGNGL